MSKYNWDEKHIITFPEEKVASLLRIYMFTMVK